MVVYVANYVYFTIIKMDILIVNMTIISTLIGTNTSKRLETLF